MAKILVVGFGYLGQHLVDVLGEEGHSVEMASRSGTGDCHAADLGSESSIGKLVGDLAFVPDWIVHCASSGRGGVEAYREVFVEGSRNLMSHFPDAKIMLTSSTSVYPQTDGSVVTEASEANPDRETAKCLREAEEILLAEGHVVLRLSGIYGPGRSIHLKRIINGTATIESGEVSRWLNQIHRDDIASAIRHLIEKGPEESGEIYNVSDSNPITQRACYEALADILLKPVPPEAPPNLNGKRAWTNKRVSNEKLRSNGWIPVYPSFLDAVKKDERLVAGVS